MRRIEMIPELETALMDANHGNAINVIVNQAYDNMGLQSTRTPGPILDGARRNTPEGREFVRVSMQEGVKAAVIKRDGPFNDYSQGPPENQPRKRSDL